MVMMGLSDMFIALRRSLCAVDVASSAEVAICTTPNGPTAEAWSMFVFGIWMLALGSSFIILSSLGKGPLSQRVAGIAVRAGFPPVLGPWSRLFGMAIASFALFYFAAALFELRPFFWVSVFGRLGVCGVCVALAWHHHEQRAADPRRARLLIWFALPDLVFAMITASLMLPNSLARTVFLMGVADLLAALGLFAFPGWALELLGVQAKPGPWTIILGTVLGFFGSYAIAFALLDVVPIMWSAVLASFFLLVGIEATLVTEPAQRTPIAGTNRLKFVVLVLLLITAAAAYQGSRKLSWAGAGRPRDGRQETMR